MKPLVPLAIELLVRAVDVFHRLRTRFVRLVKGFALLLDAEQSQQRRIRLLCRRRYCYVLFCFYHLFVVSNYTLK